MGKFIVETQYLENYGDKSEPYWKFKGGETYRMVGWDRLQDAVVALHTYLVPEGYICEFPVSWFEHESQWEAQLPKDKEYADFLRNTVKELTPEIIKKVMERV